METKKEFRWFSIAQHVQEQDYLREQHKKGWKFVKVTGIGIYHFEKCEPEDVIYQLDYNQEGSAHKDEYLQMFADCGWEYIQEFVGYSYFRKSAAEMNGDEEIFCDDESRLAMMERVYKGRLLPLLVLFFACLMPQFIINLTGGRYLVASFMGGILVIYVVVFAVFAVQYYRFKNKIGK